VLSLTLVAAALVFIVTVAAMRRMPRPALGAAGPRATPYGRTAGEREAALPVPRHAQTMSYYGGDGGGPPDAADVPPRWMAEHVDWVMGANWNPLPLQFKAAGGKYATTYTDPMKVPYCEVPAPPGKCRGPLGDTPETGWYHDGAGHRLFRCFDQPACTNVQMSLNPESPETRAAFHAYTRSVARGYDAVEVDDIGGNNIHDMLYRYNITSPAEYVSDQRFIEGQRAVLAASAVPVFFNSLGARRYGGPYDQHGPYLFLEPGTSVIGVYGENCFVSYEAPKERRGDAVWAEQASDLINAAAAKKFAMCWGKAHHTPEVAAYFLASWWLTYDPRWSVAQPDMHSGWDAGHYQVPVFAEYEIVPREPETTVAPTGSSADIEELRTPTGAYAREFARCYQGGKPLGPCAAVVNPSSSRAVDLPKFRHAYTRSLVIGEKSLWSGGRADWNGPLPSALEPLDAAILR
jgi:hypothetical protein